MWEYNFIKNKKNINIIIYFKIKKTTGQSFKMSLRIYFTINERGSLSV